MDAVGNRRQKAEGPKLAMHGTWTEMVAGMSTKPQVSLIQNLEYLLFKKYLSFKEGAVFH